MTEEQLEQQKIGSRGSLGGCFLWFFGGILLSVSAVCAVVSLILLSASVGLNAFLGWQMSGVQVSLRRPQQPTAITAPSSPPNVQVAIPTEAPIAVATPAPATIPNQSPLDMEFGTVTALATTTAPSIPVPPSSNRAIEPINPGGSNSPGAATEENNFPAPQGLPGAEITAPASASDVAAPIAAALSTNSYSLIPLEGERDPRPAAEHGDLNLHLRDIQPIDVALELVDIPNAGIDSNAPQLSPIFDPKFKAAYTVHNWDWGCNCKTDLLREDQLVLVGIETTPGEPVFIPRKEQELYQGMFYAVVLYASEDSLTFAYSRDGTVAHAYAVHYQGLRTDPNLLDIYRSSRSNQLPGLTLDTPVGTATDELIVAIRDKGTFMDARSQRDWWK